MKQRLMSAKLGAVFHKRLADAGAAYARKPPAELPEALIAKRSAEFDLSKFEDGYEVAVKELVEAKINHLPIPMDVAPRASSRKVVNLIDALRNCLGNNVEPKTPQKPVVSEKAPARKGMGLVKAPIKSGTKRKSA
jgi:DNA end-binding protein Ku